MKQTELEVRRIIEYSAFFVGDAPIDIRATLKHFNRNTLVRMAAILSLHYGNMSFPNKQNTLFSDSSKKHIPYINKLFQSYYNRIGLKQGQLVEVTTYRTGLELWRQIFAIPVEEFINDVEESDAELLLFKVILSINEKMVFFSHEKDMYKLDELIFLNGFLTNDSNNYELQTVLLPQLFYFFQLISFIPSNEVLNKATEVLFNKWGIVSWHQYYTTLFIIANQTDSYIKKQNNGVPIISKEWIEHNKQFLSLSLFEHLYIDEDEYIPYNDDEASKSELNIDYRRFRSNPLVKLKDGSGYVVINNQLICERLFNSLYFDFSPLINRGINSIGSFDYNKGFIEKVLFRNTFYNCLPSKCYTFPVKGDRDTQEKPKEPDFYARTKKGELIIVECKAVKMNGECRDDGDYGRLLDELHEKIVRKTRNLDPTRKKHKGDPEPIGVGQLIRHIDAIENDSFEWDKNIPDDVIYYPLLVFEDIKLVQKGILSMVNRWFYEEVKKEKVLSITDITCMPIMVTSIYTLFLQDKLLKTRGLTNVIDSFVAENAKKNHKTGQYLFSELADFDDYLRSNPFNKRSDMMRWHKQLMNGFEE